LRLRAGFALPDETDRPAVRALLQEYRRHPDYMRRVVMRAKPYLHFILDEIDQRGLPTELALLPIVESAYMPFAYSQGRAAGLWQFTPSTGRLYGLRQDWWYDGRRDIYASTQAALDYLKGLQTRFQGDWLLALAAYNAGPGRINRAMARNRRHARPTDYWALDLPRETRRYVPKLLALKEIFADPAHYGFTLEPLPNLRMIAVVDTGTQIDLALAAELAEMDIDEMYRFNPGFNRWATAPDGPHRLLVPVDKAKAFSQRLAQYPPEARVTWLRHKIEPGQTLSHIARRYHTTVALLRHTNKLSGTRIRAGQHLLVPKAAKNQERYALSAEGRRRALQETPRTGKKVYHVVAKGENLWAISRRHAVSLKSLAKWNGLAPGDVLRPGDRLVVWRKTLLLAQGRAAGPSSKQRLRTIHYTVRRGDSLYRIAQRFGVTVVQLRRWNRLDGRSVLHPGQTLTLQVDVTSQGSPV
jgi:membrane-bound lytic murein transglycosylase D